MSAACHASPSFSAPDSSDAPVACAAETRIGDADANVAVDGNGDDWFATEIRPHEGALRAYLRSKFPDIADVDDLIQETYVRLLRARKAGRAGFTRAYLFVVARNVTLDRIRHERIISKTSLEDAEASGVVGDETHVAEILSRAQELTLLRQAIQSLPPRCSEIVRMHWIEGLSYREVAGRLGLSESTVNTQLALGLIRCRRFLSLHGITRTGIHVPSAPRPPS